jgi:hypothetical protein
MPLPANTVVEKNIADVEALAKTVEQLVNSSGTKLTDTAVAVSGSSVITKEIELPAGLTDLQLEMQIEIEADQYIPYPMEEVAFDFDVIGPDNRIIMDLLVSQDSVGAFTPTGEPSIDITQIETQALVGDGQTLVLGGIFQTEEVKGTEKVPMLGDIPFLGKLFRNDLRNIEKREILIFITPKIIDDNLLDR